mmetsp:Transcript_26213/g.68852  ORF Transcript_26213/g.68852 Transcript_26213/m.68852 type:complete len:673 (-) Transcript_26213:747-2765(-)
MVTPLSVWKASPFLVSSQLPPAMSTITAPAFIAATISAVMSRGGGRPGMAAVVMTMSHCGICSRYIAAVLAWPSGEKSGLAYPPSSCAIASATMSGCTNSPPTDATCSTASIRTSVARTTAPSLRHVAMASSPATPHPATNTTAGGFFPAAVISPAITRPYRAAPSREARCPAILANVERASHFWAREIRGTYCIPSSVSPRSRASCRSLRVSVLGLASVSPRSSGPTNEINVDPSGTSASSCTSSRHVGGFTLRQMSARAISSLWSRTIVTAAAASDSSVMSARCPTPASASTSNPSRRSLAAAAGVTAQRRSSSSASRGTATRLNVGSASRSSSEPMASSAAASAAAAATPAPAWSASVAMAAASSEKIWLALPRSIRVLSLYGSVLRAPEKPPPDWPFFGSDRLFTMQCLASHTLHIGMPYTGESGSSAATGLTVSHAPTQIARSAVRKSLLISSIDMTMSYGTLASASRMFMCPGSRPATGWIAKRTRLPILRRWSASCPTSTWAEAAAMPYPGAMMISLASRINASACGTCTTTGSGRASSSAVAFERRFTALGGLIPSTRRMSRFIALHMMYDRMAPEAPTNAPVTTMSSLPIMKPAATPPHPEPELRTAITTAMSEPATPSVLMTAASPASPASTIISAVPVVASGCREHCSVPKSPVGELHEKG